MTKIDLSGKWSLYMDEEKKNSLPLSYPDTINLPDTTSHAQKGKKNTNRDTGYLTDTYRFEGYAWFRREIEITEDMLNKEFTLILERTRKTTVYINGEKVGYADSLCTPHRFELENITAGKHELVICVDNTDYPTGGGHLTSPDTQTNWNGITGEIALLVRRKEQIDNVMIFPDIEKNGVAVTYTSSFDGVISAKILGHPWINVDVRKGLNSFFYIAEEKLPLWDEYNPNVLTLVIEINDEEERYTFGMRKIEADGMKIRVNGNETFLRGKHDGLVFPLTGFAPTSVEEWKKVFATVKEYGINHYRFHTCCPPEAAFTAADEIGIYMQPELPFWGTVPDEITDEQQFLIDEGFRILKEFGNHPSFAMMTLGNELWGNKDVMNGILKGYKELDNRHLYSDGSNNFQFWPDVLEYSDFFSGVRLSRERLIRGSYAMCDAPLGFIQTDKPKAGYSYDYLIKPEAVEATGGTGGKILIQYGTGVKEVEAEGGMGLIPEAPVITHEVGQFYSYPDYREISHYTGSIKAENIAIYQEKAAERGLSEYTGKYHLASGALSVECYKRECEAALLTENMAGFQLLDIQDFPGQGTALVGVLNSLLEPKAFVTGEQWRDFCNDTIVAARSEKLVFSANDKIEFEPVLSTTNPRHKAGHNIICTVTDSDGNIVNRQSIPLTYDMSKNSDRLILSADRKLCLDLSGIAIPEKYTLELEVENIGIKNHYDFYVFPKTDIEIADNGITDGVKTIPFVHSEEEAVSALKNGERTIYIPDSKDKLEGTYCTDFWCYPMFSSISESMGRRLPTGTLGCLIENRHPALKYFKADFHTTPQWFEPVMHCHCELLTGTDINPIVQMIDNPHRAEKFGVIYEKETEAGKIFISSIRFSEIKDIAEAKWLAKGIFEYLSSK